MDRLQSYRMRKGFSFIELLIVILIVSIIYVLGFEGIELGKTKPKPLSPMNLKESILQSNSFKGQATLMCLNKCKNCYLRKEVTAPFETYDHAIDLTDIKAYTLDNTETLVEIEYERYDDKRICLIMDFFSNGSSTQIILEDDEYAYFLPSFFGKPMQFDSPEDAKDYWLQKSRIVSDRGDFY